MSADVEVDSTLKALFCLSGGWTGARLTTPTKTTTSAEVSLGGKWPNSSFLLKLCLSTERRWTANQTAECISCLCPCFFSSRRSHINTKLHFNPVKAWAFPRAYGIKPQKSDWKKDLLKQTQETFSSDPPKNLKPLAQQHCTIKQFFIQGFFSGPHPCQHNLLILPCHQDCEQTEKMWLISQHLGQERLFSSIMLSFLSALHLSFKFTVCCYLFIISAQNVHLAKVTNIFLPSLSLMIRSLQGSFPIKDFLQVCKAW